MVALAAIGYLSYTTVSTLIRSHELGSDEQRLQRDISQLETDNQRLDAIHEYLNSDEYVESVARRLLGLVKKGETLVIVSPATAPVEVTPTPAPLQPGGQEPRWWERLFTP